jgi:cytochrome c
MRTATKTLALAAALVSLASCGGREPTGQDATDTQAASGTPAQSADAAPAPDATDTLDWTQFADLSGDAAKGEEVFLRCMSCHSLEAGKNMIGPSLHNIIGSTAGQVAGYSYSPANKNSGIVWTGEKMFQYLEKPQRVLPGTKMAFAGLTDAQDRADLIAYLTTASK